MRSRFLCRLGLHKFGRVAYDAMQFFPPSRVPPPPIRLFIYECERCGKVRAVTDLGPEGVPR